MGGANPYIDEDEAPLPTQPFKVTFREPDGKETVVDVDPTQLPVPHDGRPGSLLVYGLDAGVPIDHACGGVCACSTCHVIVRSGADTCSEASDDEEDMLDLAPGVSDGSRLACQCVPDGSQDLVVEIPEWNRNLARE